MNRYYMLGVLLLILFLNTPEAKGNVREKITIYRPHIEAQLQIARDTAEPALRKIMQNVMRNTTAITQNGKTVRVINSSITENVDTSDNWNLRRKSSITAQQFNDVLAEYNSPASGIGDHVIAYANSQEIDAAYALYMFIHESIAGTNPNWAGFKPDGSTTHNPGNIICAGYPTCYNGFRDYSSWEDGFDGLIDLLANYNANGIETIEPAIAKWAPSSDGNDPVGYANSLKEHVSSWRRVNAGQFVTTADVNTSTGYVTTENQPSDKDWGALGAPIVGPAGPMPDNVSASFEHRQEMYGCLADTIPNALHPSPLLQDFSIVPGGDWSFNENWAIIDPDNHYCGGQPYGGICDMASTYNAVAKQAGLFTVKQEHDGGLRDFSYADSVVIWSGGSRGGEDLVIQNNTNKIAYFNAYIEGNDFVVKLWFL